MGTPPPENGDGVRQGRLEQQHVIPTRICHRTSALSTPQPRFFPPSRGTIGIACESRIPFPSSNGLPEGFDPAVFPIISRHIFGLEPPSFGAACATITADPQYRRKIDHLHEQGARPVGELLAEIAIAHGLEADISERLARFAAIPDDTLDVTNGRCFPPDPIYEVSR